MLVEITRIDTLLPLPKYETNGAVAVDLLVRTDCTVAPGSIALLPANVIIKVPTGYMLMIAPRSSLPRKKMLVFPHSVGIIDQDYCGPEDELLIQVQNISQEPIVIARGEKIAQGIFVQIAKVDWQETNNIQASSRGGFGSTDAK